MPLTAAGSRWLATVHTNIPLIQLALNLHRN